LTTRRPTLNPRELSSSDPVSDCDADYDGCDMDVSLASRRAGNLPADVTSFVGRRHELAEVRDLLQRARLITLTGVGGVGKTRLALRAAADVRRAFVDGVWLVELAGLREPGLVGESVVATLGLQEQQGGWSLAALSDRLSDRRLLLVLDNCEHVLDACAMLADTLLKTCPDLRILATSRQPLRIAGEHCLEVAPLETPVSNRSTSLGVMASNDAVRLFVERAAAVYPGFRLDEANAAAVASICQRLDGIALALELAAGRLRAMSVEQLLTRLDSRYDVLVGGSRAAMPRQQTMRALIDWSYALCTPAEQRLWARLSVFTEGFNLAAAEQVCADELIPASTVFDGVEGLVEKSIVSADRAAAEVRYRLAETLREYGANRLEEMGDRVATQRRARDWYAALANRMTPDWFSEKQTDLLNTLRLEHGNIRAALTFCLTEPGESRSGLAIAADLRHYWTATSRFSEGRHWLDRLLAQDPDPTPERLRALCVCVHMAGPLGNSEAVDQMLEDASAIARDLGDRGGAAYVAQVRGVAMLFRSDAPRAAELLEEAAGEHRRLADVGSIAFDLALLATAKTAAGQSGSLSILDECVSLCNAAGESWIRAFALWALGVERCKAGDVAGAVDAERESVKLRVALGLQYLAALNLDALAWTAVEQEDCERAARLFGAADAIMRDAAGMLVTHGPAAPMHDLYQERAREVLGPKAFAAAHDVGLRMGFDNAVAYALDAFEPTEVKRETAGDPAAAAGLTAREVEVTQLVARGLTNRQIAKALVISQRTAEGHVEHVLAKLGFTSRAQIATWATEQTTDS
jgi:predicted ATPase/DNA-binding CsgD family transcriptional regulator